MALPFVQELVAWTRMMLVHRSPVWQFADAPVAPFDAIALDRQRPLDDRVAIADSIRFALASVWPATLRSIAATFVGAAIFDEIWATFAATPGGMVPDTGSR